MQPIDPYEPPVAVAPTANQENSSVGRPYWFTTFAFVALPLLFGIAAFAGYIALAIALEVQPTETEPVLSHGQQALLISLPICTMLGASVGVALAFLVARQRLVSALLLFTIALVGWGITHSLWNAQIAQYGRDPSEVVLYYPPTGYAAVSATLAVLVSIATFRRRSNSKNNRVQPSTLFGRS